MSDEDWRDDEEYHEGAYKEYPKGPLAGKPWWYFWAFFIPCVIVAFFGINLIFTGTFFGTEEPRPWSLNGYFRRDNAQPRTGLFPTQIVRKMTGFGNPYYNEYGQYNPYYHSDY